MGEREGTGGDGDHRRTDTGLLRRFPRHEGEI